MLTDQLIEVIVNEMVDEVRNEKCFRGFINEIEGQIKEKKDEENRIKSQKEMDIQR